MSDGFIYCSGLQKTNRKNYSVSRNLTKYSCLKLNVLVRLIISPIQLEAVVFICIIFSLPGRKKIYIGSSFLVCSGCASVYTYLTDLYPVISVSSPTKSKEIDYK